MLLHLQTVRFLCSVVAAFARLVRELRKAAVMATAACSPSPVAVLTAPAVSPIGLIASTPLPKRRKTLAQAAVPENLLVAPPPPVVVLPLPAVVSDDVSGVGMVEQQQAAQSMTKTKAAWAARRRPSRLVIPVADDAGEVAAGWGVAAVPAKEADVEVEGDGFWLASRAGPRHAMEDAYVVTDKNDADSQLAFYGVFDGHGGRAAVDFVSERLSKNVVSAVLAAAGTTETRREALSEDAVSAAIKEAYLATDSELLTKHQDASGGACAATAVVKGGDLYVAHLGDCRAVLSRDGSAAALTADHTCAAEDERARIEREGGYVSRSGSGVWRVQGSLAVSRAFGDGALKQWVVAEPAVTRVPLAAGCEFLVIASDGLWDKISNQEAVDVVSRSRATACRELVDMARRRGSRDDVTVMVVDLQRFVR
ncbi:probable protein phosphatase 2C 74 [Miscanthus floridulus]|uniref:probable protein phosphatase 2C 74 n=1 Tax=Miscanthus floridulus TaxID=154761 RepID=UPI0034577A97